MAQVEKIRLLSTDQHPCSYLPEQQATIQFVDPELDLSEFWRTQLNDSGFRRSGAHYYRPKCTNCSACKALRVLVSEFSPSRSQKRCLRINADLTGIFRASDQIDHDLYYPLYAQYISNRHKDGDMYPPSREQYDAFIGSSVSTTGYFEFYRGQKLLMVAQTDQLQNGLSSVYTFFNTSEVQRGLGNFAVLKQIELAQSRGMDFLYRGYWVAQSGKMAYKQNFGPHEIYIAGHWQRL